MRFLSVFLLILISRLLLAQEADSLIYALKNAPEKSKAELLIKISKLYLRSEPKKSLEYIDNLIDISKKNADDTLQASAWALSGKAHYYLAEYDKALENWKISLQLYQQTNHKKGEAEQYNSLGVWYYSAASDYDTALQYYLLSLKKREEISDTVGIAYSLTNIGNIYYKQNRRDKAVESFERALHFAEIAQDKKITSILLNNLGAEYEEKKQYQKALDYYMRSVEIKKKLKNDISLAVTYGSIGSTYKRMGDYLKALEYYNEAVLILDKSSNKHYKAMMLNYMADVFKELKQYDKAIEYLNESLKIATEIEDKSIIKNNYYGLTQMYKLLGDYKKALLFQEKYIAVHDSIFNEESDRRMKEAEVKYDTEKKQKENEILKRQQQINALELEKKTNRQNYLIALSAIVFLLAAVLYNRYRFKQKINIELENTNNKLVKSENELKEHVATKDKFFSIIAHDLRTPLSSLSLISDVLDEDLESLSPKQLKYYLGSISSAMSSLLNLVENLLHWARTQTNKIEFNPEKLDISDIADRNIALVKINADKKNISLKNHIPPETFVFADINSLAAVMRNLLANAVKFTGEGGKVDINAQKVGDFIEISISDTGIGIEKEDIKKLFRIDVNTTSIGNSSEKGTGLGLILCKEFVEKNGGTIRAESEIGKGSRFVFTVKTA